MTSLTGQLLLASPQLTGPEFERTVVLMVRHDEEGAMGLVLNHPMEQTIDEVWPSVSQTPCLHHGQLYRGGPCEGPLMAVHTDPVHAAIGIGYGLFFSMDRDDLEGIISQNDAHIRFFVGYAGWAPQQLEAELAEAAWVIVPGGFDHVFSSTDDQWALLMTAAQRAAAFSHLNPKIIPTDPSMN